MQTLYTYIHILTGHILGDITFTCVQLCVIDHIEILTFLP